MRKGGIVGKAFGMVIPVKTFSTVDVYALAPRQLDYR